jgi:hypothetical protein
MPQYMDVINATAARALRQSLWFPYDICLVFTWISYAAMSISRASSCSLLRSPAAPEQSESPSQICGGR